MKAESLLSAGFSLPIENSAFMVAVVPISSLLSCRVGREIIVS